MVDGSRFNSMAARSPRMSERRFLTYAVGIGLVLRGLLLAWQQPWSADWIRRFAETADDSIGYWTLALNIVRHGVFSRMDAPVLLPDALRTPGYPAFLAGVVRIFGESPAAVIVIQTLLTLSVIYMVLQAGKRVFGDQVARGAALLAALDLYAIQFSMVLWSDWLFLVVVCLLLCQVAEITASGGRLTFRTGLGLGITLAMSVLIRPIALYLNAPVILYVTWLALEYEERMREAPVHAGMAARLLRRPLAGIAIGWLLLLAPWFARNYATFGVVGVSASNGFNLLYATAAHAEALDEGRNPEVVQMEFLKRYYRSRGDFAMKGAMSLEEGAYYRKRALEIIAAHPVGAAKAHAHGALKMVRRVGGEFISLRPQSRSRVDDLLRGDLSAALRSDAGDASLMEPLCFLYNLFYLAVVYAGALVALALLGRRPAPEQRFMLFLLMLMSYFVLLSGPFGGTRFRLPLHPALYLLASLGLGAIASTATRRRALSPPTSRPAIDSHIPDRRRVPVEQVPASLDE